MATFSYAPLMAKSENLLNAIANRWYIPVTLMGSTKKQKNYVEGTACSAVLEVGMVVQKNYDVTDDPNIEEKTGSEEYGFYEITHIGEDYITMKNVYDKFDEISVLDIAMNGKFSLLILPINEDKEPEQPKPQPTIPNIPQKVRTVWAKPKGSANGSYMARKVLSELCEGRLLATVTPAIFTRLTDAIREGKSLPEGINLYIYKRNEVVNKKPND